jgi:hypothetical protein
MLWDPAASEDVANWAWPFTSWTGLPASWSSTSNCTVPVGVPAAGETGVIWAVNVTCPPAFDGLGEDVTAVSVLPVITVC